MFRDEVSDGEQPAWDQSAGHGAHLGGFLGTGWTFPACQGGDLLEFQLCGRSQSPVAMGTSAGRDSLYANDFHRRNCSIDIPKLDHGKPDKGSRAKGTGICTEISFSCSALLCEGSRGCWNAGGNSSLAVTPASTSIHGKVFPVRSNECSAIHEENVKLHSLFWTKGRRGQERWEEKWRLG